VRKGLNRYVEFVEVPWNLLGHASLLFPLADGLLKVMPIPSGAISGVDERGLFNVLASTFSALALLMIFAFRQTLTETRKRRCIGINIAVWFSVVAFLLLALYLPTIEYLTYPSAGYLGLYIYILFFVSLTSAFHTLGMLSYVESERLQ